ncbi:MAG: hypothetical protein KDD69_14565, partial [Bdellovibrionales bacterium]|nr:hypothetical protein [Bdellovibrionales bacterium]
GIFVSVTIFRVTISHHPRKPTMHWRQAPLLLLFCCALPKLAEAEVSNCDGRWTNRPCEGTVSATLEEVERAPLDPASARRRRKQSLLHDLRMAAIEAERSHGVVVALGPAEARCSDQATTIEQCQEAVQAVEQQLAERSSASQQHAKQEKARGGDQNNVAIVVEADTTRRLDCPYSVRRHGRCPPFDDDLDDYDDGFLGPDASGVLTPRSSARPVFTPGPFERVKPSVKPPLPERPYHIPR